MIQLIEDDPLIGFCHGIKRQLAERYYVLTPEAKQVRAPLLVHITNDVWIREYFPKIEVAKKINNVIYLNNHRSR